MTDIFSSHPYPGRKDIRPLSHFCEPCEKSIAYKDKAAHERGKKHKQIIELLNNADGANEYGFASEQAYTGCHNCGGPHMARECTEPRPDTRECHNCKKTGHLSKDCTEPRQITCRNCEEVGHMSKECPHPRSAKNVTCNNCDQLGHFAKDCTERKNWSKVVCHNCGNTGHTSKRCTSEPVADTATDFTAPALEGDWAASTTAPVEGDWANGDTSAGSADGATESAIDAAPATDW